MAGSWLARSSSLVLVEVHGQEHRDGEKDGEDGVEGIGDAERGQKLTHLTSYTSQKMSRYLQGYLTGQRRALVKMKL